MRHSRGLTVLKLNAFSGIVYGVHDNGDVVVARADSWSSLCELDQETLDWKPVAPGKVPVTLARWIEAEGVGGHPETRTSPGVRGWRTTSSPSSTAPTAKKERHVEVS